MTKARRFIQFIIYVLVPVGYTMRGFYLYETIPKQEFRIYAYTIGDVAWFFFIILIFTPVCLNLIRHTPLLGTVLKKLYAYERELTVLFTWLIFFHILFITLTIRNVEAAFNNITNLQNAWSWGALGGVTALVIGITSNNFARQYLKIYWERTRFLTYGTFVFGALHVAIIQKDAFALFTLFLIYLVLRAVSYWRTRKNDHST